MKYFIRRSSIETVNLWRYWIYHVAFKPRFFILSVRAFPNMHPVPEACREFPDFWSPSVSTQWQHALVICGQTFCRSSVDTPFLFRTLVVYGKAPSSISGSAIVVEISHAHSRPRRNSRIVPRQSRSSESFLEKLASKALTLGTSRSRVKKCAVCVTGSV